MAKNKYDIFISYRRDGGAQYARILQLMLIQRGYRVFLDYDELTDGVFSDNIRRAIHDAPVFMPVLSKGAMNRCVNDGDWVRKEIELAVQQGKHIVPVNPDNGFDGFPDGMPQHLKDAIGSHQHSEISFGQALGATVDLMIKNRLVPSLGQRTSAVHKDQDFDTAQQTLLRQDAHNRFMKRLGIAGAVVVIAIVLATCLWFLKRQNDKDAAEAQATELSAMRQAIEQKHSALLLQLNTDLTMQQIAVIDTMLSNMSELYTDSIWISQFEFTADQWHTLRGEPCDPSQLHMPITNVSYGDIYMFLATLTDMTNLSFELPSADVWQYAAHGGSNAETTTYVGDDDPQRVAWFADNAGGQPHPSDGQQGKEPNTLDLYDMSGNVSELCNTPYGDSGLYTVCGGHYNSPAADVAATARAGFDTNAKAPTVGFRVIIRKP